MNLEVNQNLSLFLTANQAGGYYYAKGVIPYIVAENNITDPNYFTYHNMMQLSPIQMFR